MNNYDIVIIGGGPAGLAAATAAFDAGEKSILILERDAGLAAYCSSASIMDLGFIHLTRNLQDLNMRRDLSTR